MRKSILRLGSRLRGGLFIFGTSRRSNLLMLTRPAWEKAAEKEEIKHLELNQSQKASTAVLMEEWRKCLSDLVSLNVGLCTVAFCKTGLGPFPLLISKQISLNPQCHMEPKLPVASFEHRSKTLNKIVKLRGRMFQNINRLLSTHHN